MILVSCRLPAAKETSFPVSPEQTQASQTAVDLPIQPDPTQMPILPPDVVIEKADEAFFNGDWETALWEYQSAYDESSDSQIQAAALLGIGRTRLQMGLYPESAQVLHQLVDNYPDFSQRPAAFFALAQTQDNLVMMRFRF